MEARGISVEGRRRYRADSGFSRRSIRLSSRNRADRASSSSGWGFGESGFAGMLYAEGALEKYQFPGEYYFSDGNNGLNMNAPNIGFPVSTVVCATFNETLSYQKGRAIAEEALGMGLPCILAPAANLHRNPLCGRNSEYFSEDPVLAGRMAGQETRGLQSVGVSCS